MQWVDDFRDVVKEASGSRKKASGRRSRQCEDVETAAALGAALVEALARLVRTHLRWQAKEAAEGRELAMEDIDAVKVGWLWQGQGGCAARGRAECEPAGSVKLAARKGLQRCPCPQFRRYVLLGLRFSELPATTPQPWLQSTPGRC